MSDIQDRIKEASEMIGGPGKFEGEGVETAYFYLCIMEGDGEDLYSDEFGGGCSTLIDVEPAEILALGLDADITHFLVEEDSQGFVTGEALNPMQVQRVRKQAEKLNAEADNG